MISQRNIYLTVFVVLVTAILLPGCATQTATETPQLPAVATNEAPASAQRILNIWYPDTPTTLNPYLSQGVKDVEPSRIVYEPLADFDQDGNKVAILAAEIPSFENGELAKDGKSVTWKLRQGVRWSDGEPFTSADVAFSYSYITDPQVNTGITSEYSQIDRIETPDDFTVKVIFKEPNPAWALPFVGIRGVILPRHVFEKYKGANARDALANNIPVGTGAYRVKQPEPGENTAIKPQEVLLLGLEVVKTTKIVFEPNPFYRDPKKIAFDKIIWRAGSPSTEGSRQLLEGGNVDVVYSFSATPTQLAGSKVKQVLSFVPGVDRILLNHTDPNKTSTDGEFSSLKVPHPLFSDIRVRQAFAYAINRKEIISQVYPDGSGVPAYAVLVSPPQYQSKKIFYDYNPDKAKALLDEAGYKDTNQDGFRDKDGVNMKVSFKTLINPNMLKVQKIIQENLNAIGVDVEIRNTDASILFGDDLTDPNNTARFNADLEMYRSRSDNFDPTAFMEIWTCNSIPQKANGWTGNNVERWCNPAYDDLLKKAAGELDPTKREQMFIQLDDMLVEDVAVIPLVWRGSVLGINKDLNGPSPTPWDMTTWNIQDWHFVTP